MADVAPKEGAVVAAIRVSNRPHRAEIDVPRFGKNFRAPLKTRAPPRWAPFASMSRFLIARMKRKNQRIRKMAEMTARVVVFTIDYNSEYGRRVR